MNDTNEAKGISAYIAELVYRARRAAKLTQPQAAALSGIAQGDISRLENGRANPSVTTLDRYADALGYTLKITFEPKAGEEQ